jgi:hypothetical protein
LARKREEWKAEKTEERETMKEAISEEAQGSGDAMGETNTSSFMVLGNLTTIWNVRFAACLPACHECAEVDTLELYVYASCLHV